MAAHEVDPRTDIPITLNSHSVEGYLENVKSDFTINMTPPIHLTRGVWTCSLDTMTFSSQLINYNGSSLTSGVEGSIAVNAHEEAVIDDALPAKRRKKGITVDCEYALLAIDGDRQWRKETPTIRGRPLTITFTNPSDKYVVAEDINAALRKEREPVTFPPVPNPSKHDATYIRFYRQVSTVGNIAIYGDSGQLPLEPILNRFGDVPSFLSCIQQYFKVFNGVNCVINITGADRVRVGSKSNGSFIITGQNKDNVARMIKLFGGKKNFIDLGDDPEWLSPAPVSKEKPEYGAPIDPYNLQAPYTWWSKGIPNDFINEDGEEIVKQTWYRDATPGSSVPPLYSTFTYRQIRDCESKWDLLKLLVPGAVKFKIVENGTRLLLRNRLETDGLLEFRGMPCDIIPKAFGAMEYLRVHEGAVEMFMALYLPSQRPYDTPNPIEFTPRIYAPVSDIVRAVHDPEMNAVKMEMIYHGHVQGFALTMQQDSPFQDNARIAIGEVKDNSFIPPKGYPTQLVHLEGAEVPMQHHFAERGGADSEEEEQAEAFDRIHRNPDDILPFEPFRLRGMIPLSNSARMVLRRGWMKKPPASGYRIRVAARRNIPSEDFSDLWSKEQPYQLNDIVGDLPYPASYQTTDALIAALYTSMNHAIADDADNRQHGCTAEDLLNVKYDESTCKYIFTCGPKAAIVSVTMTRFMAALFGIDDEDSDDSHMTIKFASRRIYFRTDEANPRDIEWSRMGYHLVMEDVSALPVAVQSHNPVTPSMGTENMYVLCDIIENTSIQDGHQAPVLATIPVNWSEKASSVHQPISQMDIPVNKDVIRSINIKIHDHLGQRIKFMSNDHNPVIVSLRLKKRRDG